MRLRRSALEADESRTYRPPQRLRVARALWELCRIVPVFVTCAIGLAVLFTLAALTSAFGVLVALLLSGIVMLAAGAVAALVSTIAKWAFVGRIRAGEHPLWSSFVWRTEVSDTFVEMVAAPWFAQRRRRNAGPRRVAAHARRARSAAASGATATGCPRPIS